MARLIARPRALYSGDPLAYGGAVFDDLYARGVLPTDLTMAGVAAYNLCASSIVLEREVEERAGNSETPEASST